MDQLEKRLEDYSMNVDNFPVGAANARDSTSLESEIRTLQSKIQCALADALLLQALTEVAKNSNANKGKIDDTHFAKYENVLVDDACARNLPRNMAAVAEEAAALQEALNMQPEEMEQQSSSCRSLLERIKTIVPKCSSAQLELLRIQNDINQKQRMIQKMECDLMKKKSEFANVLEKQSKQLHKKRSSKDEEYVRKRESVKNIASEINRIKTIIQGLIHVSPELLESNEHFFDILEFTRKPLNLVTYSTEM